jgi:hypothetical protein
VLLGQQQLLPNQSLPWLLVLSLRVRCLPLLWPHGQLTYMSCAHCVTHPSASIQFATAHESRRCIWLQAAVTNHAQCTGQRFLFADAALDLLQCGSSLAVTA